MWSDGQWAEGLPSKLHPDDTCAVIPEVGTGPFPQGNWLCSVGWPRATQEMKRIPGIWGGSKQSTPKGYTEGIRVLTLGAVGEVSVAFIQLLLGSQGLMISERGAGGLRGSESMWHPRGRRGPSTHLLEGVGGMG